MFPLIPAWDIQFLGTAIGLLSVTFNSGPIGQVSIKVLRFYNSLSSWLPHYSCSGNGLLMFAVSPCPSLFIGVLRNQDLTQAFGALVTLHPRRFCHPLPQLEYQEIRSFKSLAHLRMASWLCPSCTFMNIHGVSVCAMCSHAAAGESRETGAGSVGELREWACCSCTFLNAPEEPLCEMCGSEKPERTLSSPSVSQPIAKFRPLSSGLIPALVVECHEESKNSEKDKLSGPIPSLANASIISHSRKRKVEDGADLILSGCKLAEVPKLEAETNKLLKMLHQERLSRRGSATASDGGKDKGGPSSSAAAFSTAVQPHLATCTEGPSSTKGDSEVVILCYNVWFREDLELLARMAAIGNLILLHQPHIICFQEVTPNIYAIFQQASWWNQYSCSVAPALASNRPYFCIQLSKLPVSSFDRNPFRNSIMGRELCLADVKVTDGTQLLVATSHLESPCPAPPTWNQMFSPERVVQAKEALALLKDVPNAIFGGDMNWDDKLDGAPPLPPGWFDAWLQLCPGQPGLTYDSKANLMLTGSRLQKRLDRIYCQLRDFEVESIRMVGTTPIPGVTYKKERKVKKQVQLTELPVFPSDHFGLLLKVRCKST